MMTTVKYQFEVEGSRARVKFTLPMKVLRAQPGAGGSYGASPAGPVPLQPNEEDYVYLDVRALSAALVQGWWLDHSDQKVMKAAVPLLKRMPVLLNHSWDVKGIVGVVVDTWWGTDDGFEAPGIDARLRLDSAVAPLNVIRALLADPPLALSVSVSWWGEVRRSHPDLDKDDFWDLLGEELNGEIVRWVVTRIDEMPEISLVWAGADPDAKVIDNDKPEKGRKSMNANKDQPGGTPPAQGQAVQLSALAPVVQKLGLQDAEATGLPERLAAAVEELLPLAEAGRGYLASVRDEALRLAKLAAPDGAVSARMQEVITGADLETAQALLEQFGGKALQRFTARCQKCGCEVPIRSSLEPGEEQGEGLEPQAPPANRIPIYG